jgi:predicted nucleic acid-binding protein
MSDIKAFVDTNIFVYLYSQTDSLKRDQAYSALMRCERQISTQVLNEFSHVCTKKWRFTRENIQKLLDQICAYCDVAYIYEDTIRKALDIHEKYGYTYYDSLIIASALEGNCQYLLSEDMADGQAIEGRLTIRNIFMHGGS